ncbi:protein of unknown function [Magnetospirillum sp. XM-1]|nr:protein of unknown function [Magnetospirillum sp. XM-1]
MWGCRGKGRGHFLLRIIYSLRLAIQILRITLRDFSLYFVWQI